MRRELLGRLPFALAGFLLLLVVPSATAQDFPAPLITENVDENRLITLGGNTRPEATAKYDRGPVDDSLLMEHLLLLLKRSPEQERDLDEFIENLHSPSSANFHRWLTAREFGERFGVEKHDRDTITNWLERHGFTVNVDYTNHLLIDFSGTAGQVREAFHTQIYNLDINGEKHIANMSDPRIPAALAPAISGVVSLNDFHPHTTYRPRVSYTVSEGGAQQYLVVPGDLATIYNLNPLFSDGISGQGQTIVLIEEADVYTIADWTSFRSVFGLSRYTDGSLTQIHPQPASGTNNCSDPGAVYGIDIEAIIDSEYAAASAPSAAIVLASCTSTTTFGGLIALQNLLSQSSPLPALVSMSYGVCEASNGASSNAAFNATFEQAVTEGVSVFVSAGDNSAAFCDRYDDAARFGIGVTGWGSSPHAVVVGGTDFGDTFAGSNSLYWSFSNSPTYESALSYVPEIPWNDSCGSSLIAEFNGFNQTYGASGFCNSSKGEANFFKTVGGGGGPSGCATGTPSVSGVVSGNCAGWPKPSYQSVLGNPHDGVRDIPDLSLFAANGVWLHSYPFCYSGPGGVPCTEVPANWSSAGGTSFSAPIMAGIQALVNQKAGARQGNPNFVYYKLAANQYGTEGDKACDSTRGNAVASSCIFYDVTQGDNDVDCIVTEAFGENNCYVPSGENGVLSTSNSDYQPAFPATTGWDFATGIGTVNAYNLVNNWATGVLDFTLSTVSSLSITQGSTGKSTITIGRINGFTGTITLSASGLPVGVTAAFDPNPATASSTMTLTASATAATGTVTVTISGQSGKQTNTTTFSLAVKAAIPSFSLSASPTAVTIANGGAAGKTVISVNPVNGFSGNVMLTASGLPTGVTASFSSNPVASTSTLTLTASSTAATGTATVTVTGTSGSLKKTTTVQLTVTQLPTYTLSASPNNLTITQAGQGTSTITINPLNGFDGSVTFSASGLPSGVTAIFGTNPATTSSTVTLTAGATATLGTATVTITGTSGSLKETTTISLTVTQAYTLSAAPNALSVVQGSKGASTITITPLNGFKGSVTLSASGLPNGVTATFGTNPATTSSTLTLTASLTAALGTATVTITGTSGSLAQTVPINLTVTPAPNFTLSAKSTSLAITQAGQGTTTITITPQNGFSSTVALSASGLPNGVTAGFKPNPATSASTLTLTVAATASTGTATVTITGTSGSLTHTCAIKLTVNPGLTLSASPSTLSVVQGTSVGTTIIISPENGYVTLSASGLPGGVTATFDPNPGLSSVLLTFAASTTATQGTSNVTITGIEGALKATTTVTLTVRALGTFNLSASPSPVTIAQNSTGTTTITVVPADGFDQKVTLRAGGLPSGVTASFGTNPTATTSKLTLKVSSSAATGVSTMTVTGTFESLSNALGIGLIVQSP
jgi:phage terminase large subunit-like protein